MARNLGLVKGYGGGSCNGGGLWFGGLVEGHEGRWWWGWVEEAGEGGALWERGAVCQELGVSEVDVWFGVGVGRLAAEEFDWVVLGE